MSQQTWLVNEPLADAGTPEPQAVKSGYSLWEYRGNEWMMKKDCSEAGFAPTGPPTSPGLFEGHLRSLSSEAA